MMDLEHDLNQSPERSSFPKLSRCSSFSAWGTATEDGHMIMAGNADYYDTEKELKKRPIAVIDPTDGGYGYVGALWDVFVAAPGTGDVWWTAGIPPSAYTMGYTHLNLHEELARNR
jgi:hypothetical protein